MTYKVYNNGNWNDINTFYVRNNDSWQEADTVYEKRSGNWQVIYDKGPYNWTGAGVSAFGFAYFGDGADVSVLFDNTGNFSYSGGPNLFSSVEPGPYAPLSKISSLYIRYNITPPVSPALSGSDFNKWVPLATSQGWSLSLAAGIVNYASVSGNVLLARGTGTPGNYVVVASGTLELSATVASIG
jgi:hypothetical protein